MKSDKKLYKFIANYTKTTLSELIADELEYNEDDCCDMGRAYMLDRIYKSLNSTSYIFRCALNSKFHKKQVVENMILLKVIRFVHSNLPIRKNCINYSNLE